MPIEQFEGDRPARVRSARTLTRAASAALAAALILGLAAPVARAGGPTYIVRRGDTLAAIAQAHRTTVRELVRLNGIRNPSLIHPGQVLELPDASESQTAVAAAAEPAPKPDPQPSQAEQTVSFGLQHPLSPSDGSFHLVWGFMWKNAQNPYTHLGTDWEARQGQPIYAAAAGSVIAAGWGDPGGNQVFISHESGYITNYAHLDWVAVEKGQPVVAGQLIGTVGGTGTSWVHLHFALYRKGRPLDPLPYLRP